jgi:ribosomal protein S6
MTEEVREDRNMIYEVGYLIVTTVTAEQISGVTAELDKLIKKAGATMLSEEEPHWQKLAYTMRRKTVGGSYEKYDEAYFGWKKFELSSAQIEKLKKSVEEMPSMLRVLVISTVRENTYLGKRAAATLAKAVPFEEKAVDAVVPLAIVPETAPATIEEMDKSIDDMVKEVN